MVGYSSQLGRALYYNCLAGTELLRGTLELASVVLVDALLYRCLCVHPGGQDYLEYVQAQCVSYIPPSRKAYWHALLGAAASGADGGVPTMCKTFLNGIEEQLLGVFDPWFEHAEASVTAMGSLLDELLVPGAHPGGCSNIVSNPTAIVLTPLPLAHFQICGKTTACAALCADSIGLFQQELRRVMSVGYNPAAAPSSYDLSVESPFFNRYASGSAVYGGELLSMASLPVENASTSCQARCGARSRCLATLLDPSSGSTGALLRVDFFCIPDPAMILSTVFPMGLDTFTLPDSDTMRSTQGYAFTHADLLWEEDVDATVYVIVYARRTMTEASLASDGGSGTIPTVSYAQEVFVWRPDGAGSALRSRILGADDLGAGMLTLQVQSRLFDGGGSVLVSPEVGGVAISCIFPVRGGGVGGRLVLFVAFSARVHGILSDRHGGDGGLRTVEGGFAVQAIVTWCDRSSLNMAATSSCRPQTVFFVKCPAECATAVDASCGGSCNAGLDEALRLGATGTFVAMQVQNASEGRIRYLHLASGQPTDFYAPLEGDAYASLQAREVSMDPYHGVVVVLNANGRVASATNKAFPLSSRADTLSILGAWTRGQVFSLLPSAAARKPVRDAWTHTGPARAPDGFAFFFQGDPTGLSSSGLIGQWLSEVRPVRGPSGWELRRFQSQTTSATARLNLNCTHLSCAGCSTARLRLLCHQAQDCALVNCVGTTIQTRNVLCGIGNVVEKMGKHAIVTWRAIHIACAEMGLLAMRGASGELLTHVALHFPTDQFYALVCSSKDMFASTVGLGVSVGNAMVSTLSRSGGGGLQLDLTGNGDVGALSGEGVLKSTSLAGLIFNTLSTATLLPTLAMHRWLLCLANATLASSSEEGEGALTIEFGDISMDRSWMPCAKLEGLQTIMASSNMQAASGDAVSAFVEYTVSLVSGIGETLLNGMQLSLAATVDYLIGLVWSVQDVLYTFNMRKCKVPDYALRYVMQCACGDAAHWIPSPQRGQGWREGALWCVGTLSMLLVDGSQAVVYNPYSLDELTQGVSGITGYIECLSTHSDPADCAAPPSENILLSALVNQGVEPIAVWGRCKSNYAQSTWDVGAGALFVGNAAGVGAASGTATAGLAVPDSVVAEASAWAAAVSPEFLGCMRDPARLQVDYASCMRLYFSLTRQQTPAAYFLYTASPLLLMIISGGGNEPPDACLVFSGLQAATGEGSPMHSLMTDCLLQEGVGTPAACDLNPLVWSGAQPQKMAAAAVHGTVPPPADSLMAEAGLLYAAPLAKLQAAYAEFNRSFDSQAASIDTALFSADGDFIHDFFDCMFLGPYTRVDLRACDAEGVLDCPFYARDELGGRSRNFTACFGDVMDGDHRLPYTCGSPARRSLIKYFMRNFSSTVGQNGQLSGNVSRLMRATVQALYVNYTALSSRGCLEPDTGRCSLSGCSLQHGFSPCMASTFQISPDDVGRFIIDAILGELPAYHRLSQASMVPWTAYTAAGHMMKWADNPERAAVAASLSHFAPGLPLRTYSAQEAYTAPGWEEAEADPVADLLASQWGVCTALLGQRAMTLPIDPNTGAPLGMNLMRPVDLGHAEEVEAAVRNITLRAMRSGSPFVWHHDRRHAPSRSAVCRRARGGGSGGARAVPIAPGRLRVTAVNVQTPGDGSSGSGGGGGDTFFNVQENQGLSFPLYGFLTERLGDADSRCVCALQHATDLSQCVLSADTCATFRALDPGSSSGSSSGGRRGCGLLRTACLGVSAQTYALEEAPAVLDCLRSSLPPPLTANNASGGGGVRCPELGPSDVWGLFPVGCTELECTNARAWVSGGTGGVVLEGARFLNEGRAGLRLPNYRHVNATYHEALSYGSMVEDRPPEQLAQQRCYDQEDLSPSGSAAEDALDLGAPEATEELRTLFPAAQMVRDSPLVAICTRHVIEAARAEVLRDTRGARNAKLQATAWRRRCEAKVREASACQLAGVYFAVPPPAVPPSVTAACGVQLQLPPRDGDAAFLAAHGGGGGDGGTTTTVYLTPACVVVDRVTQLMYDGPLCLHTASRTGSGTLQYWTDLSDACALKPQPLSLLVQGDAPSYSMVYTQGGLPLSADWLSNLAASALTLRSIEATAQANAAPSRDDVSHVLDWWPTAEEEAGGGRRSAPGFHVTAPSDPSELAPIVFDSHYLFDPASFTLVYAHSAARNASLLYTTMGAAGVCRAANVGMPMVDTNTNRICTRRSKQADEDTPQMPVPTLRRGGGPEEEGGGSGPFSQAYTERYFFPERCAATASDVPWSVSNDDDPQAATAGGIPGWQRFVSMDAQGATVYPFGYYPPSESLSSYRLSDLYYHSAFDDRDAEGTMTTTAVNEPWGVCAQAVRWGAAPVCDASAPPATSGCYTPSAADASYSGSGAAVCLPVLDNTTMTGSLAAASVGGGVCISAATYRAHALRFGGDTSRRPCFQTSQCDDGLVCLADGACAPLHMHVWNRRANEWDMEVTVLADACGFQEAGHPFTQSMRGASPWELVPDLLSAHGFCSHREWFAYRNALWTQTCPMRGGGGRALNAGDNYIGNQGGEGAFLECNTSDARWPWVHARFDGSRSAAPYETMAEGQHLLPVPHACDQTFMHLQNPATGRRLEVCSGFQGRQEVPARGYPLSPRPGGDDDWAGVSLEEDAPLEGEGGGLSRWMRTYDESTGAVHVGVLDNGIERDVPLGFLGATLGEGADEGGVLNDMAADMLARVNFFRCTDRLACSNPSFTFNGVEVRDRLDPTTLTGNFSELSLRLCGAIGYIAPQWVNSEVGGGVCWLDVQLFPLFTQLLWGEKRSGCAALWPAMTTSATGGIVLVPSTTTKDRIEAHPLATIRSESRSLFCEAAPPPPPPAAGFAPTGAAGGRCVFAARSSTRLTAENEQDGVVAITDMLNALFRTAGSVVVAATKVKEVGPTRVYETINRCIAQLMRTLSVTQSGLQDAYGVAGPSGVYLALRVTLFEVPVAWLHHAMLVTLLSTIDRNVLAPALHTLGVSGVAGVPLFLWGEEDRATMCHDQMGLNARPVLLRLLCLGRHPAYTFVVDDLFLLPQEAAAVDAAAAAATTAGPPELIADRMADSIRSRTVQDVHTQLPSNTGGTRAYCYTSAAWACETAPRSLLQTKACHHARRLAYNTSIVDEGTGETVCQRATADPPEWMDPCAFPQHFQLGGLQPVSLDTLNRMDGGPTGGLLGYIKALTESAIAAAERIATPLDYIGGGSWDEVVVGMPMMMADTSSTAAAPERKEEGRDNVPVLRAWSLPAQLLAVQSQQAGAFDIDTWLRRDVCDSTFGGGGGGGGGICSDQYATRAGADACLYEFTSTAEELQRYLPTSEEDPVIVLHYADGTEERVPVCDLFQPNTNNLEAEEEEVCIGQHAGATDAYAGLGSDERVPCDIIWVEAPPGVQVQGFALRLPLGEGAAGASNALQRHHTWLGLLEGSNYCNGGASCPMSMCTHNGDDGSPEPSDGSTRLPYEEIRSCTWSTVSPHAAALADDGVPLSVVDTGVYQGAWWSNGSTRTQGLRPDLDGFGPMVERDFDAMGTWWAPEHKMEWETRGCASDLGLCALRVRLEFIPGISKAFCGRKNSPESHLRSVTHTQPPQCDLELSSASSEAYVVARGPNATLYRCAPCSRFTAALGGGAPSSGAASAEPPNDYFFDCFLGQKGDGGAAQHQLLMQAVGQETAAYLHDPAALLAVATDLIAQTTIATEWSAVWRTLLNGTAIDVAAPFADDTNPAVMGSLLRWGQRASSTTTTTTTATTTQCTPTTPSGCGFKAFDLNYVQTEDGLIWGKALANPDVQFTMLCQTQKYSAEAAQTCNPAIDARRRALGEFVDAQYRETDGVWMHTVAPGTGIMWVANVASAKVGLFSLMHASSARAEMDVLSRWLVGDGPCDPPATILQHRICVESAVRADAPFQPLHPRMGGEFNPFEKLDECPLLVAAGGGGGAASSTTDWAGSTNSMLMGGSAASGSASTSGGGTGGSTLCPCRCAPARYCDDPSGLHNYSQGAMAAEFPPLPNCVNQAFPRFRTMDPRDQSNLCAIARSASVVVGTGGARGSRAACPHRQGLLGHAASAPRTVSFEELHSPGGVSTAKGTLLVQELLGGQGGPGANSAESNGFWAGRTLLQERTLGSNAQFAFLRMPRHRLHPAHIAMANAPDLTGAPLVVARVSLLYAPSPSSLAPSLDWPLTLGAEWLSDAAKIARLYPQLARTASWQEGGGDWSCPLRTAAFWGGRQSERFAPMLPSPVLSHALYGLRGAHPLIRARSAYPFLRPYRTTNGACFYEVQQGQPPLQIAIADAANQCGLRGMLRLLDSGEFALSRVVNRFTDRCNTIIDAPDLGGTLRSEEILEPTVAPGSTCGVLHRLSPFLIRTRGDAGSVGARTAAPFTTRDDGGDCHMGRALLLPVPMVDRGRISGAECALIEKNRTHAVAGCPFTGTRLVMARARPLTLDELLAKSTFYYRERMLRAAAMPRFVGPGN
jgi:hypothetical protein